MTRACAAARAIPVGALLLCMAGCGKSVCARAEDRMGHRVCVHRVPDEGLWAEITFPAEAVDQVRTTTYLVPAVADARLPTVLVDAGAFEDPESSLHFKFLTTAFPQFAFLTYERYVELILEPELREWFAGNVTEYITSTGERIYGFTVWDTGTDPAGTITCAQFRKVHRVLDSRIEIGEAAAIPANALQRDVLAACDVPTYDPTTALEYEVYTQGRGCGTLEVYTLAELAAAEGTVSWQDVLVTDEAPFDIETVISGIITGTRQGTLSHLNVRLSGRGTPNCYLRNAYDLLLARDGELVELSCNVSGATVTAITPAEAEACWNDLRPDPVDVVPADLTWTTLMPLLDLPTATPEERLEGVGRYGSKGTNLATLYQRIDPDLQLEGFLIPFHHYDAFMTSSTWTVDMGSGTETLSFAETIDRFLDDPAFMSDAAARQIRLAALQDAMRTAPCDPALVAEIETHILSSHGTDDVMVRFRSSSNAEDALAFTGAGLYRSTSVCLADETDGDGLGPSRCDPDQPDERSVCRGLTRVWSSLWNMKAFEERTWYSIDHRQVVMGILVNTRTKGELANIVAFSANPFADGDDRYLVNAQLGELDVVSAAPGVFPEKDLLTIEGGLVVGIERAAGSSELPDGSWVLDDALLEELGAALWSVVDVYPVDAVVPEGLDVLVDTEWKLRPDGRLAIKQIRPFLY